MLKSTSKDFRQKFILEFTKELIRNTYTYKKIFIIKEVKEIVHHTLKDPPLTPRKEVKEIVIKKVQKDVERIKQLKQEEELIYAFGGKSIRRKRVPFLRIPTSPLPQTMQGITPFATRAEIDLGKLNPLIRDPLVKIIECHGPDEKIIVTGRMGRKPTSITLSKEQIEEIINRFAEVTKIPVDEGVFKAVFGNLILSAMISEIVGSKFILWKMS